MCGGEHPPAVAFWVDEALAIRLSSEEAERNAPLRGYESVEFRPDGTMIMPKVR